MCVCMHVYNNKSKVEAINLKEHMEEYIDVFR